jgi:SEC-C motif-containing protein
VHDGSAPALTAEAVMRARYSAFVVGDEAFLHRSWHPATRPTGVGPADSVHWLGLEILGRSGGGAFDSEGTVTFTARYRSDGTERHLHEASRFIRVDGAWLYHSALPDRSPRPG